MAIRRVTGAVSPSELIFADANALGATYDGSGTTIERGETFTLPAGGTTAVSNGALRLEALKGDCTITNNGNSTLTNASGVNGTIVMRSGASDFPAFVRNSSMGSMSIPAREDFTGDVSGTINSNATFPANSIVQVQYVQKTDTFSTTSGTLIAIPGLNVNITPSSSSNKILITCHIVLASTFFITHCGLFRNNTEIGLADVSENRPRSLMTSQIEDANEANGEVEHLSHSFLDSPNTTSQVNYGLRMARRYDNSSTPTSFINRSSPDRSLPDGNETYDARYISTIHVMEIAQ